MSEINPNPENVEAMKEKLIEEIRSADEFILFLHGNDEEGEGHIQTICCASGQHFPHFAASMQHCQMTLVHTALGEMLGIDKDGADPDDRTAEWLHPEADALPDPDTVEVPDFVPDFSDDAWNKPGGEF